MDMPTAIAEPRNAPARRLGVALSLVALQVLAAVFFVADSIFDAEFAASGDAPSLSWMEVVVAVALLGGIVLGAAMTRRLLREASERERVIALASGALADVIAGRFAEWALSGAESDVALFALKGFSIAEIAKMRGSAEGTVRAQLSQVYAKAGVSSQAMLMALFLEELLDA